ncbi:MAG: phenylalanine 4-monooxygenase [Polyangiaceae bacterium]|jgi:phenylalanine-4-hydroxylase|nr:phenylalanine 4-monooxygenase [Polyangiaceae bacterium]
MQTVTVELSADHPGFNDNAYRKRRNEIASLARALPEGAPAPVIAYAAVEHATWRAVFDKLVRLYPTHACSEFTPVIREMGYTADHIPQLEQVSAFLQARTGFRLQPVAGLVSPREFLGALGRGVFCSTQYIRHHSNPHYTPEPDIVHELMGHAPMLSIPAFADLSRKIGEGSVHATDDQVGQLATLYWYTIEYGVVRQHGQLRAYGAGLLSSFGELEHAIGGNVEVRKFNPQIAKDTPYPITTYQPLLWEVQSIREAFDIMNGFVRQHILRRESGRSEEGQAHG